MNLFRENPCMSGYDHFDTLYFIDKQRECANMISITMRQKNRLDFQWIKTQGLKTRPYILEIIPGIEPYELVA